MNEEFTNPARRFKLPVPLQEDVQQKSVIQKDRTEAISAAIVKIMKSRRTLSHAVLITEVINHLTLFRPQPQDIKGCIESLIQREFLGRSDTQVRHLCVCARVCTRVCAHVCVPMCVHMCVYVFVCTCVCLYVCTCECVQCVCFWTCVRVRKYIAYLTAVKRVHISSMIRSHQLLSWLSLTNIA